MKQIKVSNEKELQEALLSNYNEIVLESPNAISIINKIEKAERKRSKAKKAGILVVLAAVAAAPFTGGTSLGLGLIGASFTLSEAAILAIISGIVSISKEAIDKLAEYKIAKLDYDKVLLSKQA
jgi:hypothetical protein